jgi:KEOPS complex subunit Pcc1
VTRRPHATTLVFEYSTATAAAVVARSVEREVGEIEGDRTTATLSRDGDTVTVEVEADDVTALRAGLNTWTTLVEVAESVAGVAGESGGF